MYTESLIPYTEIMVLSGMLLAAAIYKYVQYKKYVRQYPYKVQRYLRTTDRIIRTWSQPSTIEHRSKTVYVGILNGKPFYLKEKALYNKN